MGGSEKVFCSFLEYVGSDWNFYRNFAEQRLPNHVPYRHSLKAFSLSSVCGHHAVLLHCLSQ